MNANNSFANSVCTVEIREDDKEIFVCDLVDKNNEPAFYSTSKRGIKKLFAHVRENFNEETTFGNVSTWCDEFAIRTHHYCRMD